MSLNFGTATISEISGPPMNAFQEAHDFAQANGKITLIGQLGEQAGRAVFATSILVKDFLGFTKENPILSGEGSDYARVDSFDQITQRAIDPPHVKEIVDYLRSRVSEDKPVILPGVILNCEEATLFVQVGSSKRRFGVLCIDEEAPLLTADGMHRKLALNEVLNPKKPGDRLNQDKEKSIRNMLLSAMITFETDKTELRNDFASVAQAKPIPHSVQIAFRRNGINDFTTEILKATPFLHYHTNTATKQTGPKSAHAWMTSTVSRSVRVLVNGKRSDDEDMLTTQLDGLRKQAKARSDDLGFDDFVKEWWMGVQNAFAPYRAMGALPKAPANFMTELRAEGNGQANMILLNTTGLELLAGLGHDLWKHGWRSSSDIAHRLTVLKGFDWSGSNPWWLKNAIPFEGASVTQKAKAISDATTMLTRACHTAEGRTVKTAA